jgi:hypothetical protein
MLRPVLPALLDRINNLAKLEEAASFEQDPKSSLGLDDAAIYPLQVSVAPRVAILSSIGIKTNTRACPSPQPRPCVDLRRAGGSGPFWTPGQCRLWRPSQATIAGAVIA